MSEDPKLPIARAQNPNAPEQSVPKPTKFDLTKFRSKSPITAAGVETLLTALPLYSISQAKGFCSLASGRRQILVARIVLRQHSDQRSETRHAALDRRRTCNAVSTACPNNTD